jgi:hypothetical protein
LFDPTSFTYPNTYSNADSNTYSNTYTNAYPNAYSNTYTNARRMCYCYLVGGFDATVYRWNHR